MQVTTPICRAFANNNVTPVPFDDEKSYIRAVCAFNCIESIIMTLTRELAPKANGCNLYDPSKPNRFHKPRYGAYSLVYEALQELVSVTAKQDPLLEYSHDKQHIFQALQWTNCMLYIAGFYAMKKRCVSEIASLLNFCFFRSCFTPIHVDRIVEVSEVLTNTPRWNYEVIIHTMMKAVKACAKYMECYITLTMVSKPCIDGQGFLHDLKRLESDANFIDSKRLTTNPHTGGLYENDDGVPELLDFLWFIRDDFENMAVFWNHHPNCTKMFEHSLSKIPMLHSSYAHALANAWMEQCFPNIRFDYPGHDSYNHGKESGDDATTTTTQNYEDSPASSSSSLSSPSRIALSSDVDGPNLSSLQESTIEEQGTLSLSNRCLACGEFKCKYLSCLQESTIEEQGTLSLSNRCLVCGEFKCQYVKPIAVSFPGQLSRLMYYHTHPTISKNCDNTKSRNAQPKRARSTQSVNGLLKKARRTKSSDNIS
jgi:hypothetical protein